MKKILALLLALSAVPLTGCLATDHYKAQKECDAEAEQILSDFKQPFIDKVKDTYGNSAEVTDIHCLTFLATGLFYSVTKADDWMSGTLALDGNQYEVDYNYKTDAIRSAVYTETICSELIQALPIDQNQIIDRLYPDTGAFFHYSCYRILKFDPDIKTLDNIMNNTENGLGANPVHIIVFTTEPFGEISESQLKAIPAYSRFGEFSQYIQISVVTLRDDSELPALKEMMLRSSSLILQYNNPDTTEDSKTAFRDKYHIANATVIENSFKATDDGTVPKLTVFNI